MRELARLAAAAARSVGAQGDALAGGAGAAAQPRRRRARAHRGHARPRRGRLRRALRGARGPRPRDVGAEQTPSRGAAWRRRGPSCTTSAATLDATESRRARRLELAATTTRPSPRRATPSPRSFSCAASSTRAGTGRKQNLARARAPRSTTETLRGVINLGVIAIWQGRPRRGGAAVRRGREGGVAARRHADAAGRAARERGRGRAPAQGRFGDALQSYQEALGILTRVGNRQFLARVANNLGELYVQVGEVTRARRLCEYASQVGRGLSRRARRRGAHAARAGRARRRAHRRARGWRCTRPSRSSPRRATASREAEAHLLAGARFARRRRGGARARRSPRCPTSKSAGASRLRDRPRAGRAELERAEGRDALAAARRAIELAERTGDEDLRLRAHAQLALALARPGRRRSRRGAARRPPRSSAASWSRGRARGLRVSYDAQLGRAGVGELTSRLEVRRRRATTRAAGAVGARRRCA